MALRSKTLRRLGLIENWNWPLLIFVLPLYVLFSILFDAVLTGNASWYWLVTFIAGTLAEVLFVVVCKKLFLTRLLTRRPSGLIGAGFAAIVNVVRNLTVAWLALELNLLAEVNWLQRTLGAAIMGIAFMVMFVSIMGSRIEHASTMGRLQALQRILVQQRQESTPMLNAENVRMLEHAQKLLLPKIERVQELLAKHSKTDSLQELRNLVTEHVRPLSAELSSAARSLSLKPAPAPIAKVPGEFMSARVKLKSVIRPGLVVALTGPGQWVVVQLLANLEQANRTIVGVFFCWAILVIAKSLIPVHVVVNRVPAILSLLVLGGLSGLPAFALNVNSISNQQSLVLFSTLVIAPILATFGFAIQSSLDSAREEAEQRIRNDNEALERETALFEQRMWLAKRAWSFVVHGTVQGALTAAITRLNSTDELEQYQFNLVLQDLDRAKNALSRVPVLELDLPNAISALSATWQGICDVRWNISHRAERALKRDANARMCVNEIAKEAVSNAVRHGEARSAWVDIDRTGDELLIITISNNGRPLPANPILGVGTQMLDGLTLNWDLSNNKATGLVVLEAQLPILR